MPTGRYRGISLFSELVDEVESFIKEHPEIGYKTITEFCADAVRRRMEEVKKMVPARPKVEHFNLNEDGVLVLDRTLNPPRVVQIFFRPDEVYCEFCESRKCRHVEFALDIPKVQDILQKKGWKIK